MSERRKLESEIIIKRELEQAQRSAHNAINVGRATIEELELQGETLNEVEDKLEDNDDILQKSLKVIRGMTWSGSLYNTYTDVAKVFTFSSSSPPPDNETAPSSSSSAARITANDAYEIKIQSSSQSLELDRDADHQVKQSEEDLMLQDISKAVSTLHKMGINMGEQIEAQNQQLDRIDEKSEKVYEQTINATIKASQMNQRLNKDPGKYLGTFQFLAVNNLFMLAAAPDNSLILSPTADLRTLFRCFIRQKNILGFQNEETGKWLGCTMWGGIAVSGEYFGGQEECFIDLNGGESGMLIIARNWNAGGWLSSTSPIEQATVPAAIPITSTTSSIVDKTNIILFKAIRCK